MNIDLSGRQAFVSGSTQGIGRVVAARLAAAGAATTINGRDYPPAQRQRDSA
jgi:NAD(P)-dependent dehydrogenase (short-subunit alcohol dehydrogenase family)